MGTTTADGELHQDQVQDGWRARFDEWGARYLDDAFASEGERDVSERELDAVLGAVGRSDAGERARVLDLGCGPGRVVRALQGAGHEVVGADQAPSMAATVAQTGTPVLLARAGQGLGVADGSFDAVTCVRVLKYLPVWDVALAEAARVLRPGGRLVLEVSPRRSVARLGYRGEQVRLVDLDELVAELAVVGTVVGMVAVSHVPHPVLVSGGRAAVALDRWLGRRLGVAWARSVVVEVRRR